MLAKAERYELEEKLRHMLESMLQDGSDICFMRQKVRLIASNYPLFTVWSPEFAQGYLVVQINEERIKVPVPCEYSMRREEW